MALVEIDNLSIGFAGRPAVSGLSLAIGKGQRFGIIGESGSGKSLTALAMAGLLPDNAESSGTIRFDGAPLPRAERDMARLRASHIGMVFQEPMTALNPLMKIGAQIAEAADLSASGADVAALLLEVGLQNEHRDRFPHQLSGGQRQRAMIAMALAGAPDLLIADEPTSALDVITQRKVLDLIAAICDRRGMSLLFISHDMRAVAALCSHISVMQNGQLVEQGETAALLAQPRAAYTQKLLAATRMEKRQTGLEPGATLLELEAVSRDYGQGGFWRWTSPPLRAVNTVSFSIGAGECVALVGPSGCGKTTLARMIVGLDSASSGVMRLNGRPYHGRDLPPSLRAGLSLVFQDPFSSFDPRMNIAQSLAEPLHLLGPLGPGEREARLREAIMSVGLDPAMLARYPHEFSGGQRQRLAIARAMVTRPRLVVLDEPVSALDVSVRAEVLNLLARLRQEHGLTYLIISHDLDMVAAMADRVLVMEAGQIVETGSPKALFANPQHALTRALMAARLPDVA
ncbi:dipeptide ABC transporter ATP-binding protein [Devosia faecipullorum]|uniref:dipeptide ABC transporter ATP-binding protein n=1 Tax=Devosia faecipullorum TaxID=2755039 RepID=UPI00187B1472|nr:ABC transporter ATP-binding protein [Devosia faecipullorum]MBE7733948.1 ABC transporter ATP-binding protein [Devosia faecipullorum]